MKVTSEDVVSFIGVREERKFMKRYVRVLCIIFAFVCVFSGYYIWCSYHPEIRIGIIDAGRGEELKIEVPAVVIAPRHGINPAAAVELELLQFWIQYDDMYEYLLNHYKAGDINLDIEVKDNQTILTYSGTATTLDDEHIEFNKEIICEFALKADIRKY